MVELYSKLQFFEVEVCSKCEELSGFYGQFQEVRVENFQFIERICFIEVLLEVGQVWDVQDVQVSWVEVDQQQICFKELEFQVLGLEKEVIEFREVVEQQKVKNNDFWEKNWKVMEVLVMVEQVCKEKLYFLIQVKEELEKQFYLIEVQIMEVLLILFLEFFVLV